MTRIATDNVAIMKGVYEAFGRGDVPTVLEAIDERVEWHEAEGNPWHPGRPLVGRQEVIEVVFTNLAEHFDGFEVRPARFLGDGDTVVMEGRYWATKHRQTGKPLDAEVVHVWDLRDGKITKFHQYVDTRQWADVLGVSTY